MRRGTRFTLRWDTHSLVAAIGVLFSYLVIAALMPKHVFWAPDEGGRLLQISAIHWSNGISFDLPYQGRRLDPSLRFYPRGTPGEPFATYPQPNQDGSVRFHWPLPFSLLSWPLWRTFGYSGLYVIPLACAWLIALFTGQLASFFEPRLRAPAIWLTGLASPIFFYSQTLWDHTLASLCALLAALILVRQPGSLRSATLSAVPLLAALSLRLELAAYSVGAAAAWTVASQRGEGGRWLRQASRWKLLLLAALGVGAAALFMLLLPARHRDLLPHIPYRFHRPGNLINGAMQLLVNSASSQGPLTPFTADAVVFAALVVLVVCVWFRRTWAAAAFLVATTVVLAYSAWLHALPESYRAVHGLVPIAPYVVFGAAALPWAWQRAESRLTTLAVLTTSYLVLGLGLNFIAYSSPVDAAIWNSLEWGPRYVLSVYPLLIVLALVGFRALQRMPWPLGARRLAIVLGAGMVWVAVLQEARGLTMLHENRVRFAAWDEALRRHGPIVTDLWWLPTTVAAYYITHEMYFVHSRRFLPEWIEKVAEGQVPQFAVASLRPAFPADFGPFAARLVVTDVHAVGELVLTSFRLAAP